MTNVLSDSCRPSFCHGWRMPAGVHGVVTPASQAGFSRQPLSPARKVCGECRRNYIQDLRVPGSSPGRAFAGAVAQRAEHQTRSRGSFLHLLSPQRIAMAPGLSVAGGHGNTFTRASSLRAPHNVGLHGAKAGIVIRQRLPLRGILDAPVNHVRSNATRCN